MKYIHKIVNEIKKTFLQVRKVNIPPEIMALLLTIVNYYMIESYFSDQVFKMRLRYTLENILIIYLVFVVLMIISKHVKVGLIIGNILFYIYMLSQFYIMKFRGAPWQLSDLNFGTVRGGTEVANAYSFNVDVALVYYLIYTIILCVVVLVLNFQTIHFKRRIVHSVLFITIFLVGVPRLEPALNQAIISHDVDFYSRKQPYRVLGQILMFSMDAASGGIKKPDHYSLNKVKKLANETKNIKNNAYSSVSEDVPNIIGIMNESFADFDHIAPGKLKTNQDYIPFIRNMSQNTIKGYVTVSAYGGYSCNSEYEFLTGNTLGLLPVGSTAFTQFLNEKQPSLVSLLHSYGYTTEGLSGCTSNIWGLKNAYNNLQFDKKIFYEDLEKMNNIQEYRGYVTDDYLFQQIEKEFVRKKPDQKLFIWNTTMQNHGGYDVTHKGDIKVLNNDISGSAKNKIETYLGSINKTDEAVQKLINYFSKYPEKTVIVMFGDHYPHIPELFEYLYGKKLDEISLKETELMHQTPFFIWANYDISAEEINSISLNYLATKVMDVSNLKKSGYQLFLSDMYQELPVVSGFGYEDKKGKVYSYRVDKEYESTLNDYHILQYNNMFGKRINHFFD